ncbi:MAG: hypothetical protein M3N51_05045 [Actinomycetota bacterium]|nr:hypothetical protein [Actinomycetota bacterium]
MPELLGAILLGSFAAGSADALSDLDLVLVAPEGSFAAAWARRHHLHPPNVAAHWDHRREEIPEAGAHKWLTAHLVLVECLIATPSSGVRLAEPAMVVAGPAGQVGMFPGRPPISRSEMGEDVHPIERAYDTFKGLVRKTAPY